MAVIDPTQPPALFRSIGRWLRTWMDAIAAKPGSRLTGADGVTGPWHDLGIAESKVRTLAGRWPDSAATLSGRLLVREEQRRRIQAPATRFATVTSPSVT
jgi:hypothetical protein